MKLQTNKFTGTGSSRVNPFAISRGSCSGLHSRPTFQAASGSYDRSVTLHASSRAQFPDLIFESLLPQWPQATIGVVARRLSRDRVQRARSTIISSLASIQGPRHEMRDNPRIRRGSSRASCAAIESSLSINLSQVDFARRRESFQRSSERGKKKKKTTTTSSKVHFQTPRSRLGQRLSPPPAGRGRGRRGRGRISPLE